MAGVLIFSVLMRYGYLSPRTYYFVGQTLFEEALKLAKLPAIEGKSMLDAYNVMLRLDDLFIIAAVPSVTVGCITALARAESNVGQQREVLILSFQVRRVKTYLYLGALFLVMFIVELMAWMQLPSFLLTEAQTKLFDQLVRAISTYYGVQCMFVLSSYYIPVSFVLLKRIRLLAVRSLREKGEPITERSIADWQTKSGLAVHNLRSYRTLAALFSPLLTGLLGGALAAVGGGH